MVVPSAPWCQDIVPGLEVLAVIHAFLLLALSAAPPPKDAVAAFNLMRLTQNESRLLLKDKGRWHYKPADCAFSRARVTLDGGSMFLRIESRTGPDCDKPDYEEFCGFKTEDGRYVWLYSRRNIHGNYPLEAYEYRQGKMVPAVDVLKSIPAAADFLPAELLRDAPEQARAVLQTVNLEYILPRGGNTVVINMPGPEVDRVCNAFDPVPPSCEPGQRLKMGGNLTATWNKKTGRFTLAREP